MTELRRKYPHHHSVASFRHRVKTLEAVCEWIDNSNAAGAKNINIKFQKDWVIVTDDGKGCPHIDYLWCPGESMSQHDAGAMGIWGIGAKDAMLHFGSVAQLHTVYRGRYHYRTIDWDKVEAEGWPFEYIGKGKPAKAAPEPINQGGTAIIVSRLTKGRSRINPEILLRRLSQRYRGMLRKKTRQIFVWFGESKHELSADAEAIGTWNNEKTTIGMAADRGFSVRYTDLKTYDPHISGIHIGFGDRFIEHLTELNGVPVPNLLYAEVTLRDKWKGCLNANKTQVDLFRDELQAQLAFILKDWIETLTKHADEARIEQLNVFLHNESAQIFQFDPTGTGYKRGEQLRGSGHGGDGPEPPGPPPGPKPEPKHEAEPNETAEGGKKSRKIPPPGVFYKKSEPGKLGKVPYKISHDKAENKITIELNGDIPSIEAAYHVPYKIPVIWPLVSSAFANWCRINLNKLDVLMPGMINHLINNGYDIDVENADGAEPSIYHWLMLQQPELTKAKLREVA